MIKLGNITQTEYTYLIDMDAAMRLRNEAKKIKMTEQLKMCPKCNSAASIDFDINFLGGCGDPEHCSDSSAWGIVCSNNDCKNQSNYHYCEEDAIEEWNKRT